MNREYFKLLEDCTLCPRQCHADRTGGQTGCCGGTAVVKAARASLHQWEEPCLSGTRGSGTVFFSGCALGCVYCQNGPISQGRAGREISVERLAEIFMEQQGRGAHNLNLVTADHYLPQVAAALDLARRQGCRLPVVWNCSGYQSLDSLRRLEGLVDIWLADFKYMSPRLAERYSGAADYPQVAQAALPEMFRQQPVAVFDRAGLLQRGLIIRHLLLPGCLEDSKKVLAWLFDRFGNRAWYSLMSQYTPPAALDRAAYPELLAKVSAAAYQELVDFCVELGLESAWVQEGDAAQDSFIPAFEGQGL